MDYLSFAVLSVALFALIRAWLRTRGARRRVAVVSWIVLLLILAVGWVIINEVGESEQHRVQRMLQGFAPTYAQEFERLGHARLGRTEVFDSTLYLTLIELQKRWLAVNPVVADIYTMRRDSTGEFYLVVDSETDYDRDGVYTGEREQRTPFMTRMSTDQPGAEEAMEGNTSFSGRIYSDFWGTWVSMATPMYDDRGRIEAVLGVDYDANTFYEEIVSARLRTIAFISLVVMALFSSHIVVTLARIDLRRKTEVEEELRRSRDELERRVAERTAKIQQLATAMEQMAEDVLITDPEGHILYVNPAFERITGYTQEEVLGNTTRILESGEQSDEYYQAVWDTIRSGEVWRGTFVNRRKDGSLIHEEGTITPIHDEDGTISGFVSVKQDITAEMQLRQEYRFLVDSAPEGIILSRADQVLTSNPAFAAMFGYNEGQEMPKDLGAFFAPEQRAMVISRRRRREAGETVPTEYETIGLRSDGSRFPVRVHANRVMYQGAPAVLAFLADISETHAAREALRASEEKFARAFHSNPLPMAISTLQEGRYLDVNAAFETMFRYPREELIGATVGDLGIWADPDDRQRMVATLREHGHVQDMDTRFRVKGGDVVPARYFTSPITIGGEIHLLSVIQDVTARKAAEEQIAQSLREKEVLLKEIHHRVKNNMQVISSLLSLQSRYLNDARLQEVLKESQQRIRSMALAHEALYRSQNLASIPFGDYARTVVNHLLRSYAPHAVEVDVQTDRYALEVDQAVPAGLILNELVSNTLKHAFPGGRSGHVTVEIRETDSHECRIIVQDDGVGLPADLDIGTTATLGMELVRSLTEQLEGTLVYSGENGTRFEVRFQKSDRS